MPKNWKRRVLSGLVAASMTASFTVTTALAAGGDAPDFGELYTWEDVQAGLAESDAEVDAKVDALIKAMTTEE